jgi:hypothetical protein
MVVLAAATAAVAVAQVGILVAARPRRPAELALALVPAGALAVLLVLAWRSVAS